MRNKRILIPIIILLIILSSWAFRWDIMATKSTDYGVFKWTRDRWSNTVIYEQYKPGVYNTTTARRGWTNPNTATYIWLSLLGVNGIWLLVEYRRQEDGQDESS
jgi:hypothetical protein